MDDYTYDDAGLDPMPKHSERKKREIIAETTDGVPIYTQSYADARQLNDSGSRRRVKTTRRSHTTAAPLPLASVPVIQAGYHNPAWPSTNQKPELKLYAELDNNQVSITSKPIITRSSRVIVTPDVSDVTEEQQVKARPRVKSLETRSYQSQQSDELNTYSNNGRNYRRRMPVQPTQRQRVVESFEEDVAPVVPTIVRPTRRHMPAAHFHGDTSKYALGVHQNYHGNGHLKHLDRTYVDWISSDWMKDTNQDGVFDFTNGVLTINEDGLYFVYSQIFYVDDHDLNGYHVYRNQEMILQCTTMTHSTTRVRKSNTCYTAGVEKLAAGDRVYVRDLSNERLSLFEKGKSFFGVLKLSDMRVK
ncbi:protein eiger-like [Atheta coriaria]|uniref:protein eiger-like n=1 Tax=Dalotia coriaria TaxID=877792 RepID=UPI0031F35347